VREIEAKELRHIVRGFPMVQMVVCKVIDVMRSTR